MDGETIGGLIILGMSLAAALWTMSYMRERSRCPRCGDPDTPTILLKHRDHKPDNDDARDLVWCIKCHHEWLKHDWDLSLCPSCGDESKPWVLPNDLNKLNKQHQKSKRSTWNELVRCRACSHQWRRVPLSAAGRRRGAWY